jgi:hypothetical protein
MDQNVSATQKIVIIISIILGFLVVFLVGISLWNKAKLAENELAQKEALDAEMKKQQTQANVSITNEANNTSGFTFESLTEQDANLIANENSNNEFQVLATTTSEEEIVTTTNTKPVSKPKTTTTPAKKVYYNTDRPLTAEEIRRIRMLPIGNSATGNLQNKLETETSGQYQAQYK